MNLFPNDYVYNLHYVNMQTILEQILGLGTEHDKINCSIISGERGLHTLFTFFVIFSKIFNAEKVVVLDDMDDFISLLSTATVQLDIRDERERWFKRCFEH